MAESEVLLEVRRNPLETTMMVNMGPQHPSTHGVLRLVLTLDGERVVDAKPDIGYLHTGMEKLAEYKKYQHVITITDRTDYLNAMGNNLGYVLAVEKMLGVEVPPRAQVIRVMMAELQRIASHLVWIGTHGLDLGAMSLFFYAFALRACRISSLSVVTTIPSLTRTVQAVCNRPIFSIRTRHMRHAACGGRSL